MCFRRPTESGSDDVLQESTARPIPCAPGCNDDLAAEEAFCATIILSKGLGFSHLIFNVVLSS